MLLLHLVTLQSDVKLRHHVSWPKQDQICPYSLTGVQVPWSSLAVEMRNWSGQIVNPFGMLTFRTVKVMKCCSYWTNTTAYILFSILKAPSLILDVNAQ